jgi:putative MATE family efflux protein
MNIETGTSTLAVDDSPDADKPGHIRARIAILAAPTVVAMVTQTFINQADHIMVGWLPPEEAVPGQAALFPCIALLWMVGGALSALLSVGTQALTARRIGEGKPEEAGQVLSNSLAIAVLLAPLASAVAWVAAPAMLGLINKDPAVVGLGTPFLRWRYVQVLGMVITNGAFKPFFDGMGKTWVHMVAAIVMNVINLALNYALIFGHWGMPRLGVEGSGLASCVSSYVGMLVVAWYSMPSEMRQRYRFYRVSNVRWSTMRQILGLSWPTAMATVLTMTGFLLFGWIVGRIDRAAGNETPLYSAATAGIISVLQLVFISCSGSAPATAPGGGQTMGAKRFDRAERSVWEAAKIGFLFFLLVPGLLTFLYAHPILSFWCHASPQVADAGAPILRVLGVLEPVMCLALVFTYALYGAGNPRFVLVVEAILHFGCLVPLAYVLGVVLDWGMWGVWTAMITYVLLLAGIMAVKFSQGSWKAIKI